jgi:hypothetical protein
MTGGSSAKNASCERIIAWFEHHMRWVLITAFGVPVEPEVNRNLTTVSGPDLGVRGVGRRSRGRRQQCLTAACSAGRQRVAADDDLGAGRHHASIARGRARRRRRRRDPA